MKEIEKTNTNEPTIKLIGFAPNHLSQNTDFGFPPAELLDVEELKSRIRELEKNEFTFRRIVLFPTFFAFIFLCLLGFFLEFVGLL